MRDINISKITVLPTPKQLIEEIELSPKLETTVSEARGTIRNILEGTDKRFMMIIGPCSIHSVRNAIAYAKHLKQLSEKVSDKIYLVMRAYIEKPRTTLGWPGLLYDPDLNGIGDIKKGLTLTRKLFQDLTKLRIPIAIELLDLTTPQYHLDFVSYATIGARTSQSQLHRHFASGISVPVGFKNGVCGSSKRAVEAALTARYPHTFPSIDIDGRIAEVRTVGNPYSHIILRGGDRGPNYDEQSVDEALELLKKNGINLGLIVDANHDNSQKDYRKQPEIVYEVIHILRKGKKIAGVMVESNTIEGRQETFQYPLTSKRKPRSDQSITDPCLGWKETEKMVIKAYKML